MKRENFIVKKYLGLVFLLFIPGIFPLAAANVSFLVIETGLPKDGPAAQYSIMWENSLMDVFFEMGHIISNSPMMRLDKKPPDGFPDIAERDFEEAQEGGMAYFLVAVVEHPIPYKVSMRLYRIRNQEMIREQFYTYGAPKTEKEEYDNIKRAVASMAARLR